MARIKALPLIECCVTIQFDVGSHSFRLTAEREDQADEILEKMRTMTLKCLKKQATCAPKVIEDNDSAEF